MIHTFSPDAQGHIFIDGNKTKFSPGDMIIIGGNPKDVLVSNMIVSDYVHISNDPASNLTIGDPLWSGGAYSYALMFKNCSHVNLFGSREGAFKITGSKTTALDTNGFGKRGAYFNLRIDELSNNFKVHDIQIRDGGTGVWCKSEVTNDARTWWPNYLENFEFYNLDIRDTYVEGMYIGHTGTYWNIKNNQPYYPTSATDVPKDSTTAVYKQPIKLKNVSIRNCFVSGVGFDGIQTAAIENLIVENNEVTNWAVNKNSGHNAGILIGGRVKNFTVKNNRVHDGWGEMLQVYAEDGEVKDIVNNLFANNKGEAVFIRGTNALAVNFINNTVVAPGGTTFRVNGYFGGTGKNVVRKNLFVQPSGVGGIIYPNRYIYLENGGAASDEDNAKIPTLAEAKLSSDGFYSPAIDSKAAGYGYVKPADPIPEEPPVIVPATVSIESEELAALVASLKPGEYPLLLQVKQAQGSKSIQMKITIS